MTLVGEYSLASEVISLFPTNRFLAAGYASGLVRISRVCLSDIDARTSQVLKTPKEKIKNTKKPTSSQSPSPFSPINPTLATQVAVSSLDNSGVLPQVYAIPTQQNILVPSINTVSVFPQQIIPLESVIDPEKVSKDRKRKRKS